MLASNRLRIDPGNGRPAIDYRIENDFVESRTLEFDAAQRTVSAAEPWRRLTPAQLTSRVMADKVVAQWLQHKLGLHRLIRACNQSLSSPAESSRKSSTRTAA